MKYDNETIQCYKEQKANGATKEDIYAQARADGYKNYECLLILMGVFNIELHEAREVGHKYFYEHQGKESK